MFDSHARFGRFWLPLALGASLLAAGCQAPQAAPLAEATVHLGEAAPLDAGPAIVVHSAIASAYRTLAEVAPYGEADVKRLEVALYRVEDPGSAIAEDAVALQRAVLTSAMFTTAVTFGRLKPGATYRVRVRAFDQAEGGAQISLDVADDEAVVTLPALPAPGGTWDAAARTLALGVRLKARDFAAAGTSPGLMVSGGRLVHAGPGGLQAPAAHAARWQPAELVSTSFHPVDDDRYAPTLAANEATGDYMLAWLSATSRLVTQRLSPAGLVEGDQSGGFAAYSPRLSYSPVNRQYNLVYHTDRSSVIRRPVDVAGGTSLETITTAIRDGRAVRLATVLNHSSGRVMTAVSSLDASADRVYADFRPLETATFTGQAEPAEGLYLSANPAPHVDLAYHRGSTQTLAVRQFLLEGALKLNAYGVTGSLLTTLTIAADADHRPAWPAVCATRRPAEFLLVWVEAGADAHHLKGATATIASGAITLSPVRVLASSSAAMSSPKVAHHALANEALVSWHDAADASLKAMRVGDDAGLTALEAPAVVADDFVLDGPEARQALAFSPIAGEYMLSWIQGGSAAGLYTRRLSVTPAGSP